MEKIIDRGAAEPPSLCYLEATQIEGPLEAFNGVEVRDRSDGKIGRFDGIVIDPAERRVRYLVVDNERFLTHQRYLLPLDATHVDIEHKTLCVDADQRDLTFYEEFDAHAFRSFSFRPRQPLPSSLDGPANNG
jgi:hypothetical protein